MASRCEAITKAFVFKNAIAVPGMLHILSNILRDAHTICPMWPQIWNQLKNIERLVSNKHRMRRLIITCVLDSALDQFDAVKRLESFSESLYEERLCGLCCYRPGLFF